MHFPLSSPAHGSGYKNVAILLILLVILASSRATAQDSLFVAEGEKGLYIRVRVEHGDDLFLLSKRFYAPPARVAGLNNLTYQSGLRRGSMMKIPIGKYNYVSINSVPSALPLYYRVKEGESLRQISRKFNVPQSSLQRWNGLAEPEAEAGGILQAGWIKYDASQVAFPDHDAVPTDSQEVKATPETAGGAGRKRPDPKPRHPDLKSNKPGLSATDSLNDSLTAYERQFLKTTAGRQLQERSGAVVFYTLEARVEEGVYYALFDGAPSGSIVEITNPSNGRVIYAKTIGALPDINDYQNAIMGLSNNAVRDLGANSRRIFCRVRY